MVKSDGSKAKDMGDRTIDRMLDGVERAGRAYEKASEVKESIRNEIKGPRSEKANS